MAKLKSESPHLICGFIFCPAKGTSLYWVRHFGLTSHYTHSRWLSCSHSAFRLLLVFPCSTGSSGWRTAISEQLDLTGGPGRTRLASKSPSPQRVGIRGHQNAAPSFVRFRFAAPVVLHTGYHDAIQQQVWCQSPPHFKLGSDNVSLLPALNVENRHIPGHGDAVKARCRFPAVNTGEQACFSPTRMVRGSYSTNER